MLKTYNKNFEYISVNFKNNLNKFNILDKNLDNFYNI